jgi:hypothetical protein
MRGAARMHLSRCREAPFVHAPRIAGAPASIAGTPHTLFVQGTPAAGRLLLSCA